MRQALPREDLDHVIGLTGDVWRALSGTRWFVTGGTGFIGSWLLEVIQHANTSVSADIDVVVLSRAPQRAIESASHLFGPGGRISLIAGDVTTFATDIGAIDVCVHAATDVADTTKAADYQRIFDSGTLGTRRVLDAAIAHGASRFLLTSSGAVYGTQPPELERVPESYGGAPDPLDYRTAYGQGKRAAEWLATAAVSRGLPNVAIARIFALLGPGLPLHGPFAAGNFIRDALAGQPITIRDGRPVRSYLYASDACIWLLHILLTGANGGAYNLGSERPVSIADLAGTIERLFDREPRVEASKALPNSLPPRYVPDTSKARTGLGLAEYTSLEAGLTKTINWSRAAAIA
ncbi:NAD-dependent epimerase/dehydratase family protein [Paraburkholderia phenazinium]|uniref:dTDP-glucose 4,6-dehydratase n=1 Tax=Paraburkholderia phenazinium TaxID=60549 RepID=A0A1N6LGY3_9BURK|nr:NAD-dependent epimerase/dehydratase family protein [Paraburkholderia phenazinium]SIO67936.1 dTDP-glucose 4,6-dehydratase [Paraburkholderia phenazinium]